MSSSPIPRLSRLGLVVELELALAFLYELVPFFSRRRLRREMWASF